MIISRALWEFSNRRSDLDGADSAWLGPDQTLGLGQRKGVA
jgi:hypothetical protein